MPINKIDKPSNTQPFKVKNIQINSNVKLHIIDIEEITIDLKNLIDKEIISICESDDGFELDEVKNDTKKFLSRLENNKKIGAIAEFFIHLYVRYMNFNQHCLFRNLEEDGSMKKGFDGYYSKDEEEWIMESKSGFISTKNITHKAKVTEAYNGLKSLILNQNKKHNNPWRNALHHAKVTDTSTEIQENIKEYNKKYRRDNDVSMGQFNLMPCGTIFLDNIWSEYNAEKIILDISNIVEKIDFNKLEIICITKKSLQLFEDYLNE